MRTLIMEGNSVQRRTGQASRARGNRRRRVCRGDGDDWSAGHGVGPGQEEGTVPRQGGGFVGTDAADHDSPAPERDRRDERGGDARDVVARQVSDVQIVSGTRIIVTGEDLGTTTVVLQGADGNQYVFDVIVEPDLAALNESIKKIDPLSDASASAVQGSIILTGRVSNLDRARRMAELAELFLPMPDPERTHRPVVQNHLEVAGNSRFFFG